jgi:hypothetical protein
MYVWYIYIYIYKRGIQPTARELLVENATDSQDECRSASSRRQPHSANTAYTKPNKPINLIMYARRNTINVCKFFLFFFIFVFAVRLFRIVFFVFRRISTAPRPFRSPSRGEPTLNVTFRRKSFLSPRSRESAPRRILGSRKRVAFLVSITSRGIS